MDGGMSTDRSMFEVEDGVVELLVQTMGGIIIFMWTIKKSNRLELLPSRLM